MAGNDPDKANGPAKSFMTVGPTLHYSHGNVIRCWWLAVVVYVGTCLFWSWILTGKALNTESLPMITISPWALGDFVVSPISIYEYPWQISILGLLMGVIAVGPILVSQLLSFRYSLPLIIAAALIARLPLFAAALLISCIAVACRPLRFRSRFISIALCITPQLIYWAVFGSAVGVGPIKWGFSFAPWIGAWLTGLAIAGAVLGIGHFTRYKPGLVFSICGIVLAGAVFLFFNRIGFAELDYQLYVANNNPEEITEFHDHSMTGAIDNAIADPSTRSYLEGLFYPSEPILLREDLKNEIQKELSYDRWPSWFLNVLPDEFKYQDKRQWLLQQYDHFTENWSKSKRMPIALYYKAMLYEYKPDIRLLGRSPKEILHFYSDYPHSEAIGWWYKLYNEFGDSPESLEARWRIAMHLAGKEEDPPAAEGQVDSLVMARQLCTEARTRLEEELKLLYDDRRGEEAFLAAFVPPSRTIMTPTKLMDLKTRIDELEVLTSEQNRTGTDESRNRLARFVLLNPYGRTYADQLDDLQKEMPPSDPLMDNVLLAKAMLLTDSQRKANELKSLGERFAGTDAGIRALYELGLLKVTLWKESDAREEKKKYLAEARATLTSFIERCPESIFSDQARIMLDSLPAAE